MARQKANKTAYRTEGAALLTEWPADWDASVNTPLTEEDFAPEMQYLFWDNRKEAYAKRAAEAEEKAEFCRKYPDPEVRKKVLELQKQMAMMEALRKELEGVL